MKSLVKFALFLGLGLTLLYFVYQNQAKAFLNECACTGDCIHDSLLAKLVSDFSNTNLFWLSLVCLCFLASALSRAMRWNILIEPLGYKVKTFNSFFSIMIGYLINLAIPRAGELARPATLNQYEKVPLDKLIGTIVIDRIFDMLMLLLILGLTFIVQFDNLYNFLTGKIVPKATCINPNTIITENTFPWEFLFFFIMGVLLLSFIFILIKWQKIKTSNFYKKLSILLANFWQGILTVKDLKHPYLFIFHTVFIWFMFFTMTYLCFFAYEPTKELGLSAALLAFIFGSFGIVIPSPGGMGTYQLAVMTALIIYGIEASNAFAFANIIFFTINIFCNVIFGMLAYIVMPLYNKNYTPVINENN